MNKASMDLLVEGAARLGLELRGREEYSGRSMYGRTTAAVTAGEIGDVLAAAASAMQDLIEGNPDGYGDAADQLTEDLRGARIDSMGKGIVVY